MVSVQPQGQKSPGEVVIAPMRHLLPVSGPKVANVASVAVRPTRVEVYRSTDRFAQTGGFERYLSSVLDGIRETLQTPCPGIFLIFGIKMALNYPDALGGCRASWTPPGTSPLGPDRRFENAEESDYFELVCESAPIWQGNIAICVSLLNQKAHVQSEHNCKMLEPNSLYLFGGFSILSESHQVT